MVDSFVTGLIDEGCPVVPQSILVTPRTFLYSMPYLGILGTWYMCYIDLD